MHLARQSVALGFVLTAALLTLGGCDGQTNVALPPEPGEAPAVALDTPQDAARTMLLTLRYERRAIAHKQKELAKSTLETLEEIASAAELKRILGDEPRFNSVVGEDLVLGYVRNWGATVSYYIEGVDFDRLRVKSRSAKRATVLVPARGEADEAWIKLVVVQDEDQKWRVGRIEFATNAVATASPTPAPTTSPASAPAATTSSAP